tara:strand:+ start:865 stop:2058 length:1194 start_codon:yes stop_codon:yes gene_type:complete
MDTHMSPTETTPANHRPHPTLHRVTPADGRHYFFGYYEKFPWDQSQQRLLSNSAPFRDRRPSVNDAMDVGYIDLSNTNHFHKLAQTTCWNWQQGCMLQWFDNQSIVHNIHAKDGTCASQIVDMHGRIVEHFDQPIYTLSPNRDRAYSLNFARLTDLRPGYGYAGEPDPFATTNAPADDGVFGFDTESRSKPELLISTAHLAQQVGDEGGKQFKHWVNHIQVSRHGKRIAFLHRWSQKTDNLWWRTRMVVANHDGTDARSLIAHHNVSHYDWLDDDTIVAWCIGEDQTVGYWIYDASGRNEPRMINEPTFTGDGHCTFSPDGKWMLTDTYPDGQGCRTLYIYRLADGHLIDLGSYYSPSPSDIEIRCDLHPRWSRDGKQVCIDSVHEGFRGIYVLPVS